MVVGEAQRHDWGTSVVRKQRDVNAGAQLSSFRTLFVDVCACVFRYVYCMRGWRLGEGVGCRPPLLSYPVSLKQGLLLKLELMPPWLTWQPGSPSNPQVSSPLELWLQLCARHLAGSVVRQNRFS